MSFSTDTVTSGLRRIGSRTAAKARRGSRATSWVGIRAVSQLVCWLRREVGTFPPRCAARPCRESAIRRVLSRLPVIAITSRTPPTTGAPAPDPRIEKSHYLLFVPATGVDGVTRPCPRCGAVQQHVSSAQESSTEQGSPGAETAQALWKCTGCRAWHSEVSQSVHGSGHASPGRG